MALVWPAGIICRVNRGQHLVRRQLATGHHLGTETVDNEFPA